MFAIASSLIRRYCLPTCTLEVAANTSPLSQWANKPLLKQVRFKLYLDDPRQPEGETMVLQGDREQLEFLSETVTSHLQGFLGRSSPRLGPSPCPLTTHEIPLGSLAGQVSSTAVQLSAIQLFDLANALEQCSVEVALLPELETSVPRRRMYSWVGAAAAILASVGFSAAALEVLRPWQSPPAPVAETESPSMPSLEIAIAPLEVPEETPFEFRQSDEPLASETEVEVPQSVALPDAPIAIAVVPQPQPPVTPAPARTRAKSLGEKPTAPKPEEQVAAAPQISSPSAIEEQMASSPQLPELPVLEPKTPAIAMLPPGSTKSAISGGDKPWRQVVEAEQYLRSRWQPPQELDRALKYELELNADGSIRRILPLDATASRYLIRTQMPPIGEPFVSPLPDGVTPQLYLVFHPDGTVQTDGDR